MSIGTNITKNNTILFLTYILNPFLYRLLTNYENI